MKTTVKYIKIAVMLLVLTYTMAALGHTFEPLERTKAYAFSQIRLGYLDHFDKHDEHVETHKDFMFSVPLLSISKQVQIDPFMIARSGAGLQQAGFAVPILATERLYIVPAVFHDFESHEYGTAVNLTVKLRQ